MEYDGSVTQEDLVRFLKKEGGVHIGLKGTLQLFDELAAKFKDGDKNALLKEAEEKAAVESGDRKATAELYVKVSERERQRGPPSAFAVSTHVPCMKSVVTSARLALPTCRL